MKMARSAQITTCLLHALRVHCGQAPQMHFNALPFINTLDGTAGRFVQVKCKPQHNCINTKSYRALS